jgi:hypothetical protein
MGKTEFFLMIAAIAALASACIWALRPVVLQSLHDR